MTKKKKLSGVNDDLSAFVTHEGQLFPIRREDFMRMISLYQENLDEGFVNGVFNEDEYDWHIKDGDVSIVIDDQSYELITKVEVEVLLKKYFIPYGIGLVLPRPGYVIQNLNVPFERGESKAILIPGKDGPKEYKATNKYKDYPYQSVIIATDAEHTDDLFKVIYVADDYARVLIDGTSKNGYVRGVLYNKMMYHIIAPHEIFAITKMDIWEMLTIGKITPDWFKYSTDEATTLSDLNLVMP